MSRADSQGNMFGNPSYAGQQPQTGVQQSVDDIEHPVDKLFTGQDDHLGDLGDLDDIEPMVDLGANLLDDLTGSSQGNDGIGTLGSHITESKSVDSLQCGTSSASNGDRIDSSIASVVEMVSKSGAPPSVGVAPAISQAGTHTGAVGAPITSIKRRPSNAQMAANIVAVAGQQQHLITDQRYTIGGAHHILTSPQMSTQAQIMSPMASSPTSGNLSLEHNARAQIFHGRTAAAKIGENGPGRVVNGHDQARAGVPNGARRPYPQIQPPDSAEDERIAELVKKVVAQGESQKAAAEQKAKIPRKNRRKTDLSKEASPRDDEEPFIVDGSRRRGTGVAASHVQAAASNFQATMARQQQLIKQQQAQLFDSSSFVLCSTQGRELVVTNLHQSLSNEIALALTISVSSIRSYLPVLPFVICPSHPHYGRSVAAQSLCAPNSLQSFGAKIIYCILYIIDKVLLVLFILALAI
ncbi:hypothetical protein DICVIV_07721 [Dictyocaulus viviparus]|uniref:Uncharacterized protein n=1 Tax=Dictyocaulus viviparus TaxID=29172 RepID=A0A0D8XV16_DICVI|nr:hypothetical protein DICVIV_07721 [Dictyocaulus viviparus]